MSEESVIQDNLTKLDLPASAVEWLCDLYAVIQLFDDVADGDKVERLDLNRVIWAALVGMNTNPFFAANSATLLPVMAAQIMKWQASDLAERTGNADARSYMWRAGFYEIVLMACHLVKGREWTDNNAALVLGMYGETLDEYMTEFS